MNETTIVNARIESTTLGFEDHGILTFFLHLEWEDGGVGWGGYVLGGEFTTKAIKAVLETVGVRKWEDLAGKLVRYESGYPGSSSIYRRIGNIINNKWCDLEEIAKECRLVKTKEGS